MSEERDKRELLKLKQGLVDKSDAIDESGYDVQMPQTAGEKAGNWFRYNIKFIIIGVIIIAIGLVVCFTFFITEKPDIKIYSTSHYGTVICDYLSDLMKSYTMDLNGNGSVLIEINQIETDPVFSSVNLYKEIDNGKCTVYFGTEEKLKSLYDEIQRVDKKELFCDITGIAPDVDGYLVDLRKTKFGKKNQIFSTEIFIAIKKTDDKAMEDAKEFVKNLCIGQSYI